MSTISPYTNNLQDWHSILPEKTVIFDSDAIISLLHFEATNLIDEFIKNNVSCCYIHPVLMELLNTNNVVERATRQALLDKFTFVKMNERVYEHAKQLQIELHDDSESYPSPTDIYLGACAKCFVDTFLITSNIRDFPSPSFERISGIVVQDSKNLKVLSILKYKYSIQTSSKPMNEKGRDKNKEDIPF